MYKRVSYRERWRLFIVHMYNRIVQEHYTGVIRKTRKTGVLRYTPSTRTNPKVVSFASRVIQMHYRWNIMPLTT